MLVTGLVDEEVPLQLTRRLKVRTAKMAATACNLPAELASADDEMKTKT